MITVELAKNCPFEFSKEKKVGHMRGDFTSGTMANAWIASGELFEGLNPMEKREIQTVCNRILFETFNTFDKLIIACGAEGYGNEKNLFTQSEHFDYWIRLNPVKDDYSIYIHAYKN